MIDDRICRIKLDAEKSALCPVFKRFAPRIAKSGRYFDHFAAVFHELLILPTIYCS
ncbi:MAG: hypothetical protein K6L76_06465 [Agarilytica sp.]